MSTSQDQHVSTKERMLQAIHSLPDDASFEGEMERLYVLLKIQIGLEQVDRGDVLTEEEMEQQFAEWLR